jgi:ubiquinone biosynthesis protein
MCRHTGETLLDLSRFATLVWKCLRFGLFPFARFVPFAGYRRISFAVRFRRALEDLGLTYLKLGQFLALRFDILPPAICEELNRLLESVPPMPASVSRPIVETELGGPLEVFFTQFNMEPIAAASVAQVHRAIARDGTVVAVKIQRSGLEPIFKADIRNLRRLARIVDALGLFGRLSLEGMVREFADWTLRELDFRIEGSTAEHLAKTAEHFVIIPRILWRLTTRKVLTMEYVEGLSASQLSNLLAKGGMKLLSSKLPHFDMQTSLQRFTDACLFQLFVDGFFHGDPHPGNIMFRDDNLVAFLDFGIFGSLTDSEREILAGQIECLAIGDINRSFRYYSQQLLPTEGTDFNNFRKEALEVLRRWYHNSTNPHASIQERHLARFTAEMIEVSRRNKLRYGLNYLLFWRALNNLNATLWLVAPDFDLMGHLRSFFRRVRPGLLERMEGTILHPQIQSEWTAVGLQLPSGTKDCLDRLSGAEGSDRFAVIESVGESRDRRIRASTKGAAVLALPIAVVLSAPTVPVAVRVVICGIFLLTVLLARYANK